MAIKNRTASVLARLKNQAKTEGISHQMALQLFVQEEFLRRLAMSKYKENLVLKGGMFIYTLTEFGSRPTQDMDFLMRRLSNDLNNIKSVMTEICPFSAVLFSLQASEKMYCPSLSTEVKMLHIEAVIIGLVLAVAEAVTPR